METFENTIETDDTMENSQDSDTIENSEDDDTIESREDDDERIIMGTQGKLKTWLAGGNLILQVLDHAANVEGTIFLMFDGKFSTWKITCEETLSNELKDLCATNAIIEVKKKRILKGHKLKIVQYETLLGHCNALQCIGTCSPIRSQYSNQKEEQKFF